MSSLAGTTEKLRSFIKIGTLLGAALFAIYLLIMGGVFIKNVIFPSAPDAPKQAFGDIPKIVFSNNASSSINYQINTITGELPTNLPSRMFVYKIIQPKPDLLALQNARASTTLAGFNQQETKVSDTVYQWSNPSTNATVQFDINNKNFEIRSNFISNQSLFANPIFPDNERIKKNVNDILASLQVNLDDLSYTDNSLKYYALSGNTLTPVDNVFSAKMIRISLYNNNIENDLGSFSFVYPNPEFPIVTLLVSYPSSSRMIILEGESYNHSISEESSDYPIKNVTQALDDLKAGNGYLFNPDNLTSIQITDAYLAYYLDKNTTEYVQPVYVFEGINAKGIVPALTQSPQSVEGTSE